MNDTVPRAAPGDAQAWRGYAYALGAAALWAFSAAPAKGLFASTPDPLSVAQLRSLIGFVTFLAGC